MAERFHLDEMIRLSGEAVARVDRDGRRGASMITDRQIEAMVCLLAVLGCPPITSATTPEELAGPVQRLLEKIPPTLGDPS